LQLAKGEDRRLKVGHDWVYSNEVDVARTPLKGLAPGAEVELLGPGGQPLGAATVNPHSLICARRFGPAGSSLDGAFIRARLEAALACREALYPGGHYRLIHGEADGLPGLVLDRYGPYWVAQCNTVAMEQRRSELRAALEALAPVAGIVWRGDSGVRALEGLPERVEQEGEVPAWLPVRENGLAFEVLTSGQKTGWFYDQRDNRARFAGLVAGRRVLDGFCYAGGWALTALAARASAALCLDSSATALEMVAHNAARQGVTERIALRRGDVFETLAGLAAEGESFGAAVIDPPALIKARRDREAGEVAYRRLCQLSVPLLAPGALWVMCSCSHHLDADRLPRFMASAARRAGRRLRLLGQYGAAMDHPEQPAMPETAYLKAVFAWLE